MSAQLLKLCHPVTALHRFSESVLSAQQHTLWPRVSLQLSEENGVCNCVIQAWGSAQAYFPLQS